MWLRRVLVAALGAASLISAGCAGTPRVQAPPAKTAAAAATKYVGEVSLSPEHATAGTEVTVKGSGLPASTQLDVVWNTAHGSWKVTGVNHESFMGRQFDPVAQVVAHGTTDGQGNLSATFTAPHDFGFEHDVAVMQGGTKLNQAAFNLDPTVAISPESGPVGTPITVHVDGIGYQYMYSSWSLAYDEKFTGWVSSVTTQGQATAVIPATGEPGKHVVTIEPGAFTFPYLNTLQSPQPKPVFTLPFTVTAGAPVLPAAIDSQGFAPVPGQAPQGSGAAIWVDPQQAPVGTPAVLRGRGFAPGQEVKLTWGRVVGNRVGGNGWSNDASGFGSATAAADGSLAFPFKVPDDLGGPHAISATAGRDAALSTSLTITPSLIAVPPDSVPVGSKITVHLKGGGWTETANIFAVVYDNAYIGYVCAFNSQGDIALPLVASGAPGWHYVDLYPAIYKGQDAPGLDNFRVPQLTFAQDHPGEKLPAFQAAFQVTE